MVSIRKIQENALFEAVKNQSNSQTAKQIVFGPGCEQAKEDDADWVQSTMRRLEGGFDADTTKRIRMNCQCGYGMEEKLAFLKELISVCPDFNRFADSDKAKAAGLFYENGALFLKFTFCPCPMLADVDRLETYSWCQCSAGYSKTLFEKAFGFEIDVELLKSIKKGDDICLMKIVPHA